MMSIIYARDSRPVRQRRTPASVRVAANGTPGPESPGARPLDNLLRRLVSSSDDVTLARLRDIATDMRGTLPRALAPDRLPGCPD
ncbi:MAG: hypothetical protein U5K76_05995 [Woeseiaceae bacterium]|nr:hypothetical protein [Woeseiaceae bacterium]